MRVIVTVHKNAPYCFEILGHAPNEKLCAAFSTIRDILEIGIRDTFQAACMINEGNGRFMIQVERVFAAKNWTFFLTIEIALEKLCRENNIEFTEKADD